MLGREGEEGGVWEGGAGRERGRAERGAREPYVKEVVGGVDGLVGDGLGRLRRGREGEEGVGGRSGG